MSKWDKAMHICRILIITSLGNFFRTELLFSSTQMFLLRLKSTDGVQLSDSCLCWSSFKNFSMYLLNGKKSFVKVERKWKWYAIGNYFKRLKEIKKWFVFSKSIYFHLFSFLLFPLSINIYLCQHCALFRGLRDKLNSTCSLGFHSLLEKTGMKINKYNVLYYVLW